MEILFREFLTKLSKVSHSLDSKLEKLGTFGTILHYIIATILFVAIYALPVLIISSLFPNFVKYGDQRSVQIVTVLLACIIFGFIYWLFGSKPKDYVASKINNDIYYILGELNGKLNKASKQGQKVEIKEETFQNYQHFSAYFEESTVNKSEDDSNLKNQILDLIDDLNDKLTKAKERNLNVSINLTYWGPKEMQESDLSQPFKYHFTANIELN